MTSLFNQFVKGQEIANQVLNAAIIIAIILGVIVLVVLLQGGIRKIPVQYSRKVQGRKQVGGQMTHIPLKINTAGSYSDHLCPVSDAVPGYDSNLS